MKKNTIKNILFLAPLLLYGCQQTPENTISKNTILTETQQTQPSASGNSSIEATNPNILSFVPDVTAKIPEKWNIAITGTNPEFRAFEGNAPFGPFSIQEFFAQEWLKDDIWHEQKLKEIAFLKNVYNHQAITGDDAKQLEGIEEPLFGYVKKYGSAITYFASEDKAFRGISFFKVQDTSPDFTRVEPLYRIVLYNPEKDIIISLSYENFLNKKELASINKPLAAQNVVKNKDKTKDKLFDAAQEKFKKLVETTSRKDLSFGHDLNAFDDFFHSIGVHK